MDYSSVSPMMADLRNNEVINSVMAVSIWACSSFSGTNVIWSLLSYRVAVWETAS